MSERATCFIHLMSAVQYPADGVFEDNLSSQALPSRLQAVTPEDSFTSASGFYSPRSHMASRQQSASSSDAWFDAHSQMASRASSVSTPGTSAAFPSATPAGTAVEVVLYALKQIPHRVSWCAQPACLQYTASSLKSEHSRSKRLQLALTPAFRIDVTPV